MTSGGSRDSIAATNTRILQILLGGAVLAIAALVSIFIARSQSVLPLSPLLVAMVVGILLGNSNLLPGPLLDGIRLVAKPALQLAIVLLGLQITVDSLLALGATAVLLIAFVTGSTLLFTLLLGRWLGIERKIALLIAAGTSICGASAVVAANSVAKGSRSDVAYVLACVTLFGTISMIGFPILAHAFDMDAKVYGLWAGLSIHEVAQVVVAGFQHSTEAGEYATSVKLGRVVLLAPIIIALAWAVGRKEPENAGARGFPSYLPWFVAGFVLAICVNSTGLVPAIAIETSRVLSVFLFTAALVGIGLDTDLAEVRARSLSALMLAAAATVFISLLSILLIIAFDI